MSTESKNRLEKKEVVKEIRNSIKKAQALYIAEYRGLDVSQMTDLRFQAAEKGIGIKVYKNRLLKIAADKLGYTELAQHLTGPNIFFFSNQDPISGAKLMKDFAKENPNLIIKAGIYEGQVVDQKNVQSIADLPTYEEALTMLASSLLGPLRQVSLSFKLIADENKLPAE